MSATYPRRWLAAIVFASIVVLAAGSFTVLWAAGELDSVELDVAEITVSSQSSRTFTSVAKDTDGNVAPDVSFAYSIILGGGGNITNAGVFTAPTGPATTTVQVVAIQEGASSATSTALVTVKAPKPAPDPTPVPVNPSDVIPPPPPPSTPGGESETITPAEGGTVTLTTTGTAQEPGRDVTIVVPVGAVDDFVALDVAPVASASVPPVAAALRIRVSGTVVDLTFTDIDGNPIDNFVAGRAVTITISYTQADADEAGSAQNLVIMKFDAVSGEWAALATTVDLSNMTITASVKTFSLFGVGIPQVGEPAGPDPTATPVPSVSLPATGDVAPGNNSVIAFIVLGLLLMTGGITVIRRRQVSRNRG